MLYEITDSGAVELSLAILKRAAQDYRIQRRHKDSYLDEDKEFSYRYFRAVGELSMIENFLLSEFGQLISGGRGEEIIELFRKEAFRLNK